MRRVSAPKKHNIQAQVAAFEVPMNSFETEEDMIDDPASKLVINFNQYQRI